MKFFLEADFSKGSGSIRWEGVSRRRMRRIFMSVFTLALATALIALPRT
jgi:hypothetical protein